MNHSKNMQLILTLSVLVTFLSGCAAFNKMFKSVDPEKRLGQAEAAVAAVRKIALAEYQKLCIPFLAKCAAEQGGQITSCPDFDMCIGGLKRIDKWLVQAEQLLMEARVELGSNGQDAIGTVLKILPHVFRLISQVQEDINHVREFLAERRAEDEIEMELKHGPAKVKPGMTIRSVELFAQPSFI